MAMAVPLIAAAAPAIIGAISNKGSNSNVQNAQQQRQGITAAAANAYRQQAGQLQQGINNQSRTAEMGAQHAMSPMYGPPPGPGPMPMAGNMGPAPGQVAPGLAPPGPGPQGPPPQMMNPMHIMGGMQRQQGPDAYQQMTHMQPPPPANPDTLNRMTILSALGAGPRPGNVAPTPGPAPSPSPFNPSRIMGGG